MPNKGGLGSRKRRRLRRQRWPPRSTPYGPVVRIPIRYIGRFQVTGHQDVPGTFFSKHVPLGNRQLFASDYAAFSAFHEYKITSANIKVSWSVYKLKEWKINANPEFVAATVCSFITDQESPAFLNAEHPTFGKVIPFDTVFSTLGSRTAHITTAEMRVTRHRWIPTEPQDRDWRKTENDGLCHLYLCCQTDDLADSKHAITAIVEVTTRIHLRELTIGASSVEYSEQDKFFYDTYVLPAKRSTEAATEQVDETSDVSSDWESPSIVTEKLLFKLPAIESLSLTQP